MSLIGIFGPSPQQPGQSGGPANVASDTRAGADGQDNVVSVREALSDRARLDAAFAPDMDEAQARRYAEVAQDRLITQEILSRIPVPIEALPRLTADAAREAEAKPGIETRRTRIA